jgi:hypothetical protein
MKETCSDQLRGLDLFAHNGASPCAPLPDAVMPVDFPKARRQSQWLCAVLIGAACVTSAPAQVLQAPSRTGAFASDFAGGATLPVVSNGYLVSFARTVAPGKSINIRATSLATGESSLVPFAASGTAGAVLLGGAMTASHHLLLGGQSQPVGGGSPQGFIAETDLTGNTVATVQTGDFLPTRVCAGANGSVWTLGQPTGAAAPILRSYAADGTLLQSYLPSDGLPGPLNLLPAGTVFGHSGATLAWLTCGDTTVGAYIGVPVNTWIEVDLATGAASQYTSASLRNSRLTGLTLLQQGQVYASFQTQASSVRTAQLYRLNLLPNAAAQWQPVLDSSDQNSTSPLGMLIGRDGANLVYSRLNGNSGNLSWSTVY